MLTLALLCAPLLAAEVQPTADQAAFQAAASGAGMGVKIEMAITRAGRAAAAPLTTPIYNGDQVSLTFTPSEAGYAWLINHGTSGRFNLLYPRNLGDNNRFDPDQPVRFPAEGGFPVSGAAGAEGMLLIVSPTPLGGDEQALIQQLLQYDPAQIAPAVVTPAATGSTGGSTGGSSAGAPPPPVHYAPAALGGDALAMAEPPPLTGLAFRSLPTRDLGAATATYVVDTSATQPELRLRFDLQHLDGAAPSLP